MEINDHVNMALVILTTNIGRSIYNTDFEAVTINNKLLYKKSSVEKLRSRLMPRVHKMVKHTLKILQHLLQDF